jgi:type I restriction enzyme M protein
MPKRSRPEHTRTRLPLVDQLVSFGWKHDQIQYDPEWRVPKSPSEASKRELKRSYQGFPIDLAIFDDPDHLGDWEHLLIIVETKPPDKKEGLSQLEIYLSLEPRALAGYWTNGTEVAALFRTADGRFKKLYSAALPRPTDNLIAGAESPIKWAELRSPDARQLRRLFERLLDHVVANDSKSTRRDDQLNQLCNLILVKLESDKKGKATPSQPVVFQVWKDESTTFAKVTGLFDSLKLTHSDLFSAVTDQQINLDTSTVHRVCFELANIRLIDTRIDILSTAFQVFRTATLKSEEGQYYTPVPVIRSGVTLMEIDYDDKILDPACGSGGFLLEAFRQFRERYPNVDDGEARAWAQKHLYGVDKDEINVKLTKAVMSILGDGSAHTFLGDSLREHLWAKNWPYLVSTLKDESYTCIVTNPPFGKNLRLGATDARRSHITICQKPIRRENGGYDFDAGTYLDRELGLVFLERCYRVLISGGRLGIVLPETYLFSPSYQWLTSWLDGRFLLRGMFNIPMEAFQGFCRAKTNWYVFEKV